MPSFHVTYRGKNNDMARKSFIAKLRSKPERKAEFDRLLTELLAETKAGEPGTLVYEVLRSDDDPLVVVFAATFVDEAAYQAHMTAPAHDRLVPPLLDCLAEPMELAYYTPFE